ncbi:MAG: hypothetical protein IPN86_23875 [Saprospiraceae bacterium]|nr:hypothetical protein [Saprospiraceae bacterium]
MEDQSGIYPLIMGLNIQKLNAIFMLYLNLAPIFAARGIERPYSYLVKAGFTHHTHSICLVAIHALLD